MSKFEQLRRSETAHNIFSHIMDFVEFNVTGQENLAFMYEKPAIVVFGPHTGHLDAPAVRRAFPKPLQPKLVFPMPSDYWGTPIRQLVSDLAVNTILMGRNDSGPIAIRRGLNNITETLARGLSPALSPEGTRKSNGTPEEDRIFLPGVAEIIRLTDAKYPVVPVRLIGFEDILPKGQNIPRYFENGKRKKVSVIFGNPLIFTLLDGEDKVSARFNRNRWYTETMTTIKTAVFSLK